MQQPTAHVPAPEITVDADGTARSLGFGDVYFSARGGIAETEHVFLRGNALPARWINHENFTIGEMGFGTGLNFLVAWKAFIESNASGTLHFVSIEKFPLTVEQLRTALAHQPELAAYVQQLIAHYPLRLPGLHRIQFGRVTLTLGFGDVAELLPDMEAHVDAWFLDGFAPAKNEAMWSAEVLDEIARLSSPDATFATFTAAGAVKRGLQDVGFTVEKVQGFAHKRDMLVGKRGADVPPCVAPKLREPRSGGGQPKAKGARPPSRVIIIGGGIAGCTIAYALAERGMRVTLHERDTIAAGASGNAAAVLYPQLTKYYTPATAWHFAGYDFMLRALARWKSQGLAFTCAQPGMLKIAKDEEDDARLRSIYDSLRLDETIAQWLERDEASRRVGQALPRGGFWFSHGTWLNPGELCRALVQHPNIELREQSILTTLPEADAVIVANAQAANDLLPRPLALGISAGQVSLLKPMTHLNAILCHKGYAIDAGDAWLIGATYDRSDLSSAITEKNHQENIAELHNALPDMKADIIGGRTSLRATTPSRLPHVGAVSENVYVSVGHGSRGMISAALAAEVIVAQICGEPLPVTRSLLAALAPRPA